MYGCALWKNLAVLADKYDCIAIVRPLMSIFFSFKPVTERPEVLASLPLAALILKMPEIFNLVTFKIIITFPHEMIYFAEALKQKQGDIGIPAALIGQC